MRRALCSHTHGCHSLAVSKARVCYQYYCWALLEHQPPMWLCTIIMLFASCGGRVRGAQDSAIIPSNIGKGWAWVSRALAKRPRGNRKEMRRDDECYVLRGEASGFCIPSMPWSVYEATPRLLISFTCAAVAVRFIQGRPPPLLAANAARAQRRGSTWAPVSGGFHSDVHLKIPGGCRAPSHSPEALTH